LQHSPDFINVERVCCEAIPWLRTILISPPNELLASIGQQSLNLSINQQYIYQQSISNISESFYLSFNLLWLMAHKADSTSLDRQQLPEVSMNKSWSTEVSLTADDSALDLVGFKGHQDWLKCPATNLNSSLAM
jgi:hypothetical protein